MIFTCGGIASLLRNGAVRKIPVIRMNIISPTRNFPVKNITDASSINDMNPVYYSTKEYL
ncbi:hypothetical protein OAQ99_06720 [Candidatus Kapabacteria bacterium]|nr:hypothetical protein [Candidatus Kapabacteria bacterium]